MTSVDYEAEYNNRARVPDSPAIAARWRAASAAYRQTAHAELDQHYGTGERQRYDLFYGDALGGPLIVYVHGGYWQWGDRSTYSFIAETFNSVGLNVAIPSYSLCPTVSVMKIVEEMRQCLAQLWTKTSVRPLVIGHSAGGHLTAALLATRWETVNGVPNDLVRTGIAISGIFDLQPLVHTSINAALGLDDSTAHASSPRFWTPPAKDRALVAAVGAGESREFRRQSREIVGQWATAGVRAEYAEIERANHFTVLDRLAQPGSTLNTRVIRLAHELAPDLEQARSLE
jgi:arylformamidase